METDIPLLAVKVKSDRSILRFELRKTCPIRPLGREGTGLRRI